MVFDIKTHVGCHTKWPPGTMDRRRIRLKVIRLGKWKRQVHRLLVKSSGVTASLIKWRLPPLGSFRTAFRLRPRCVLDYLGARTQLSPTGFALSRTFGHFHLGAGILEHSGESARKWRKFAKMGGPLSKFRPSGGKVAKFRERAAKLVCVRDQKPITTARRRTKRFY